MACSMYIKNESVFVFTAVFLRLVNLLLSAQRQKKRLLLQDLVTGRRLYKNSMNTKVAMHIKKVVLNTKR